MQYRISLQNADGVIDVRIVDNEKDIRAAILEVVGGINDFRAGDKIVVDECEVPE